MKDKRLRRPGRGELSDRPADWENRREKGSLRASESGGRA